MCMCCAFNGVSGCVCKHTQTRAHPPTHTYIHTCTNKSLIFNIIMRMCTWETALNWHASVFSLSCKIHRWKQVPWHGNGQNLTEAIFACNLMQEAFPIYHHNTFRRRINIQAS